VRISRSAAEPTIVQLGGKGGRDQLGDSAQIAADVEGADAGLQPLVVLVTGHGNDGHG
jgi:hypothetical protein